MRLLFELDKKDYDPAGRGYVRPSIRSIIVRDGRVAMVYSRKYRYYKFPGGGMEPGETRIDTLIRETREETGLVVIRGSVREFGYVHRVESSDRRPAYDHFIQDNYYYLCQCEDQLVSQDLDDYESDEGFRLEFVDPATAIQVNRSTVAQGFKNSLMLEREARVLELILQEVLAEGSCG